MTTETQNEKDQFRTTLSEDENLVLNRLGEIERMEGVDKRWLAIAKTHIQEGFMAAKRGLYEGKRVGDK